MCRILLVGQALLAFLVLTTASFAVAAEEETKKPVKKRPTVQLAILLDTSNSMDGLIDQAKTQLWTIVNEFAKTELAGQRPELEVALYEYGNRGLSATDGYVRMVSPLTNDLDDISEKLFALTTNGGEEYCGRVILDSVQQLDWKKGRGLRSIFIAGNEEFTQGDVKYQVACKAAVEKGITVSTIFCGDRSEGIQTGWEDGAQLADGSYLCINQDHRSRSIKTPHDADLVRLSTELNSTYIPYGDEEAREAFEDRQKAQDANAAKATVSAAASRAGFKASALYRNSGWDLVDALAEGKVELENLKSEQLPEKLQGMTIEQRREYLAEVAEKRKQVQQQIKDLTAERDAFLAKERVRLAKEAPEEAAAAAEPFADAVKEAIESQSGN